MLLNFKIGIEFYLIEYVCMKFRQSYEANISEANINFPNLLFALSFHTLLKMYTILCLIFKTLIQRKRTYLLYVISMDNPSQPLHSDVAFYVSSLFDAPLLC